jgi:hypothetical protein
MVSTAYAGKVSIAGSPYGEPTGEVNCVAPQCIFPAGVTMTEENFGFSFKQGFEVFYFRVTSDVSNFTLTLNGDANFISDDTLTQEFFGFEALICPDADPTCAAESMNPGSSDGNEKQVAFTVPGDGKGFKVFAVEPEPGGNVTNFVTATLTANSSSVPEPRSLALVLLIAASFVLLRRFRAARQS